MEATQDITKVVAQLHSLLEAKEKALTEREEAFERRLRLFEEQYPQAGLDSDVLHLNIGGSTNIAVLRRTLTIFEDSMLASRFSGRWDDSLEKDKDGNFFIDEDPTIFLQLLNFLRQYDKKKRNDLRLCPPKPTFEFCWMLEYYDLMPSVYPQEWLQVWHESTAVMTRPSSGHHSFTIQTGETMGAFMLELQSTCPTKPMNATEFTVVLERGSTGQIGWANSHSSGEKVGYSDQSFSLDIEARSFMANGSETTTDLEVSSRESPVTVRCTHNLLTDTYAIQVEGGPTAIAATQVEDERMTPYISVLGKVTISNVCYAY